MNKHLSIFFLLCACGSGDRDSKEFKISQGLKY